MAFLRSFSAQETATSVAAGALYLRQPRLSDFAKWAELRQRSRQFLTPWEPIWPRDDLTRAAFRRRVRRYHADARHDSAYAFFICRSRGDQLLGGITLSNIRRGVAQSATVGYWTGAPFAHHGVMTRALAAAVGFAFDQLRLNRLEAACLPLNTASIRVLEKCGFAREGLARQYLCINGRWQDHLLFALLQHDPRPLVPEPSFGDDHTDDMEMRR